MIEGEGGSRFYVLGFWGPRWFGIWGGKKTNIGENGIGVGG